jgi:hypothetical protein
MKTALVVTVLSLGVCAGIASAQRPSFEHEVLVELPRRLEDRLRRRLQEGFECAAVARPTGPVLSDNVFAILNRPARRTGPVPGAEVRVITGTAGEPGEFEARINEAARAGFGFCGLTVTAHVWGQPSAYAMVAVMTHRAGAASSTTYRVVRTRGRREEWAMLEKAATDGFVVSRVVSRSDGGPSNISEIHFLLEKATKPEPRQFELVFANNEVALQKEIDKQMKRGYCVEATWSTIERVSVLLAKPVAGPCRSAAKYEVDDDSRFYVSNLNGGLIGLHRLKEGSMAIYDGKTPTDEYSLQSTELEDPKFRIFTPVEHRRLTERLDVDGGRGYRPLDVTWREQGASGKLAVDIVMVRPRQ